MDDPLVELEDLEGRSRIESPEDEIPLSQLKRKMVASPGILTTELSPGRGHTVPIPIRESSSGSLDFSEILPFSPQEVRGNIFLEGPSSVGARLLKNIISPAEETHLQGGNVTHQLF